MQVSSNKSFKWPVLHRNITLVSISTRIAYIQIEYEFEYRRCEYLIYSGFNFASRKILEGIQAGSFMFGIDVKEALE